MIFLKPVVTAALIFLTFFVLLFVYTKLAGPIPFSVNSVTTTNADVFYVTGTGSVNTAPDIAEVNVGVQTTGNTSQQAQEELNGVINRVSEAVKTAGVDNKDIQTANYNINPTYDFKGGGDQITGYSANTSLTITVRDLNKANSVIDAATGAGANVLGGVQFKVDDDSKAENEAREKAVADAKKKAEDAARIAGFKLGRIINYSEDFGEGRPIPYRDTANAALGREKVTPPTQIEPGQSEVRVNVTLSYEVL